MKNTTYSEHIQPQDWNIIERPGYFGKQRNTISAQYNANFGEGNWCIAYDWQRQVIPRMTGISLYEDAYYEYLKNNPPVLEWLVSSASDVYDTAPSNVEARFSYLIQETPANHIHDVAIRRSVLRLGEQFRGDHLIHVRSSDSKGFRLSPGNVPFHKPAYISTEPIKDYGGKKQWWKEGSIEDFYQKNKILLVKK